MFGFGGASFDPSADIGDLSGKVFVVTGGKLNHSSPNLPKAQPSPQET